MNKLLFSISADHTARCWVYDVGDCTRIYKGHHHTVSCVQVENGLGKIEMPECILIDHRSVDLVFTGCGDALIRCFDARSGVVKRTLKSHTLAVNCIQVDPTFLCCSIVTFVSFSDCQRSFIQWFRRWDNESVGHR